MWMQISSRSKYLADSIIRERLTYREVAISRPDLIEEIDFILKDKGYDHLIVKLNSKRKKK